MKNALPSLRMKDEPQDNHQTDCDRPGDERRLPHESLAGDQPPAKTPRQSGRGWLLAAWLLMSLNFWLVVHGGVEDSQTFDEGVHLAAGVSYWLTSDFRLNPEHPVLWKLIAAAPVVFLRPSLPLDTPAWQNYQEWDFASRFLQENRVPTMRLLLLGRLPTFIAGSLLVFVVFLLGRQLLNPLAGLIAAFLTAFDPAVIAHSRYITTDIPVTLALTLSLAQFARYVQAPTRRNLVWLLILAAVACLIKYSALLILAVFPFILLIVRRRRRLALSPWRFGAHLLLTLIFTLGLVYGLRLRPAVADPRVSEIFKLRSSIVERGQVTAQPALIQDLIRATEPDRSFRRALDAVLRVPLPFYWYIRGTSAVLSHAYWGQHAYLFGRVTERGWWWYFPAALFLKLPPSSLSLIVTAAAGLVVFRLRQRSLPFPLLIPLLFLASYGVLTVTSRLNLGIRHLLPIYPLLFLIVGWLGAELLRRRTKARWLFVFVLALLPVSTLPNHPREIGYFSQFVGGERRGERFLLDSNLDWGQDLIRLRRFMERQPDRRFALAYAGTADPKSYGITAAPFQTPNDLTAQRADFAAISLGKLVGEPQAFGWLQQYERVDRIGASILVFAVPER